VSNKDGNDTECKICYNEMTDAILLPCGHKYCNTCTKNFLKISGKCPICSQYAFNKNTKNLHVYTDENKHVNSDINNLLVDTV